MALTFPLSAAAFIDLFKVQRVKFYQRRQDQMSRTRGGFLVSNNLTDPFWIAEIACASGELSESSAWEAIAESVGVNSFNIYNPQMPNPKADPTGLELLGTSQTIHTIGSNNRSLRIQGLPSSFVLNIGDMLSYTSNNVRGLHRVRERVVASGTGITPTFEVTPHLKSGISVGGAVSLVKPQILMKLDWSSYSPPEGVGERASGLSFTAYETRS